MLRAQLSSPAKAGDPVFQRQQRSSGEAAAYWIAGSSRAMTAEMMMDRPVKPGDDERGMKPLEPEYLRPLRRPYAPFVQSEQPRHPRGG